MVVLDSCVNSALRQQQEGQSSPSEPENLQGKVLCKSEPFIISPRNRTFSHDSSNEECDITCSSTSSISSIDECPHDNESSSKEKINSASSIIAMRVAAKIQERASFFSPVQVQPSIKIKDYLIDTTEDVKLLRKPLLTLQYFWQGVCECCASNICWPSSWSRGVSMSCFSIFVMVLAVVYRAFEGEYGTNVQTSVYDGCHMILEVSFWIGCGVLATAGLGSGVQTGALILFPHVCKLALDWAEQSDDRQGQKFTDLMWEVFKLGFWTGTGSAIGELVPYVLARMIRAAGGDPFALLNTDDSISTTTDPTNNETDSRDEGEAKKASSWTSVLIANTRSTMERQMLDKSNAFTKIFILSAIPNALFDLCGLVCGSAGISFTTFFLAVWSGKALVRTPLQTCSLAALVGYFSSRDNNGASLHDDDSTSIQATVLRMGRNFVTKFLRGDVEENSDDSPTSILITIIKLVWTGISIVLFFLFLLSTVEQIAQHHAKTARRRKDGAKRMLQRERRLLFKQKN